MGRISVELVPRSYEHLDEECEQLRLAYPDLDTINIPDLLRMPIHSWEACRYSKRYFSHVIPHLRAIDFDLHHPRHLEESIEGFSEVLVVSGDLPQGIHRQVYATRCLDMINHIVKHHPEIKVYAGLDPYRQDIREELQYARAKLAAGATALFTQPFFSVSLMLSYRELLGEAPIYWGLSPVTGVKSKNYWEYTNHAVFPCDFEFTLEANQAFARRLLQEIQEWDGHAYFMPIKVNTMTYLSGVLDRNHWHFSS